MKIGNDTAAAFALATNNKGSDNTAISPETTLDASQNSLETATKATERNMLEDNFFKRDYQQSQYVEAMLSNFDVENDFRNRMQGMMDLYSLEAAAADPSNYAEQTLAGTKAANSVEGIVDQGVTETSAEELKKEREEREAEQQEQLEAKAEEKKNASDSAAAPATEETLAAAPEEAENKPAVEKTGDMPTARPEAKAASSSTEEQTEQAESRKETSPPGTNVDMAV